MLTRVGIVLVASVAGLLVLWNRALTPNEAASAVAAAGAGDSLDQVQRGCVAPELDWQAVESELAESIGIDVTEREQLVASMMEGPVDVDLEWIEKRHPGTRGSPRLHEAHSRAIELNLELSIVCAEYYADLDQCMKSAFSSGRYLRSADSDSLPTPTEPLIFMQSGRVSGWTMMLALRREDYPQLAYKQRAIVDKVNARDQEIARILRGG